MPITKASIAWPNPLRPSRQITTKAAKANSMAITAMPAAPAKVASPGKASMKSSRTMTMASAATASENSASRRAHRASRETGSSGMRRRTIRALSAGVAARRCRLLHLSPLAGRGRRALARRVRGPLERHGPAATPPHPSAVAFLGSRPLPASGERWSKWHRPASTSAEYGSAMRLLVTRPGADAERTAGALRARGHEPVSVPLLAIEFCAPADFASGPFAAVVMTSANAARAIAAHASRAALVGLPLFTVGAHTAEVARETGFSTATSAHGGWPRLARLGADRLAGARQPLLYLAAEQRA